MNSFARIVTLSGLILTFAGCMTTYGPSKETLIAHRGHLAKDSHAPCAPENTLAAFQQAVNAGFGFECDIRYTKDRRVFTMHDASFARCFGGANATAAAMDWKDVEKLVPQDQTRTPHPETRAALFEEVCALARPDRFVFVELKTGPEIVPLVKDILAGQDNAGPDNLLFISFNDASVKAVKQLLPQYKAFLLMGSHHWKDGKPTDPYTVDECLERLRACGADGLDFHYDPLVPAQGADFVKAIRDAGFEYHCWTVDTAEDVEKAFAIGAMTVTSNRGAVILNELAVRRPAPPVAEREWAEQRRFMSAPGMSGF